jgi:signal transduction histidine kinase
VGGREIEQGLWMNWEQLQGRLLRPVADIYPDARLRPVTENVSNVPSRTLARMLASIPAELVMTAAAPAPGPAWTPLRSALLATWVVVVLALAGLALAMRSMAELAARRGQFVSAVTHELRTPLTTFRLYSQMLASGMVREEADRTQYARTLFGESERLGRIVESVLEYARLGKGEKPRREALKLAELRDRLGPVLQGAANEHGAEIVDTLGDGEEATVRVDPSRIERILVNLVDNAGKYGKRDGEPARVEVLWSADAQSGMLRVSVRDHGPGIPAAEARRVFRPFTRGAIHAHGSTPGMGLGLALARGLAEQCGGSVTYEPREGEEGARFVLRTPGT